MGKKTVVITFSLLKTKVFKNVFISVLWVFVTYISLISEYCFSDTISAAEPHVSQDNLVFLLHTYPNKVLKFGSEGSGIFFYEYLLNYSLPFLSTDCVM